MQNPAQRSLWKVYLAFLAPMVLSNFLQSMSGTLNSIYIGQLLGTHALAAVSGMFPIVFFFIALVIGLGAGAGVLIGQAWGAREPGMVKAIAGATLLLGVIIGVVAAVLGSVFARQALVGLGTPADVLEDAVAYARVMMWIMPLLLVFVLFTQLLRGVSDTVSPLLALLVSASAGLLLTPALIRGWLGLPVMGIQSAAIAGVVGNAMAMAFLAWRLLRRQHVLAPDRALFAAMRLDMSILGKVLRIGLPTGLQMVVISLSELVILSLVNQHGSQGHGGLRRGDADRQLRAVPGAVDRHYGVDPRGASHWCRTPGAHRADPAHRVADQCRADRWPGGAGLPAVPLAFGAVHH